MQRLETGLKYTPTIVTAQGFTVDKEPIGIATPQHGLMVQNGKSHIQSPPHHPNPQKRGMQKSTPALKENANKMPCKQIFTPSLTMPLDNIIQARECATRLKKLVQAKSPTKEYDVFRKARLIYPECSSTENDTIKKASQPCGGSLATTLFFRYLISHGLKDRDESQEERDIVRKDFLAHMAAAPEYAVTLALIDYIETAKSPWFPTLGVLIEAIEIHMVFEPRIMDWERGFCSEQEEESLWEEREGRDMEAWCDEILAKSKEESQEQRKLRGLKK